MSTQDRRDMTLKAVLNESAIEWREILKDADNSYILKHNIYWVKHKIVVLRAGGKFRMFIYTPQETIENDTVYKSMDNTWSVYNTLCNILRESFEDKLIKHKNHEKS